MKAKKRRRIEHAFAKRIVRRAVRYAEREHAAGNRIGNQHMRATWYLLVKATHRAYVRGEK